MNITQIEQNLKEILQKLNQGNPEYAQKTFIYDFLLAFGIPKASISKLQKGSTNLAKKVELLNTDNTILWKNKLCFKPIADDTGSLYAIEQLKNDQQIMKHNPRFLIVTDYKRFVAIDTKTTNSREINITDLLQHFRFFLPWAGVEEAVYHSENIADVKAAEKMAKFFDEIRQDNPEFSQHELNLFLSRLLFCLFANDTGIFSKKLFTKAIHEYTQEDGSDLHKYLDQIFAIMNLKIQDRRNDLSVTINIFPYVNGGLFKDNSPTPKFSKKSRQLLLDSGELDWSEINPDIFGSMIQAVVDSKARSSLGMHYTSVPNIMKVINPLFLNELNNEYEQIISDSTISIKTQLAKLARLRDRISKIKIFDPACGSGNFLIIAYKELRKLEIKILKTIDNLTQKPSMQFSAIRLTNFYGIEIDDFAHEIAKLSLWLAEHQMNIKFDEELGVKPNALPLKQSGHIVCANACRIAWEEVCPKSADDEIYVLGNPPYLGARYQEDNHRLDLENLLSSWGTYKTLDYIVCWFYKGAQYIKNSKNKLAFVSTNSICQGEQMPIIWQNIFNMPVEIAFAYTSFKWNNSAKYNAGVTVVIVGLKSINNIGEKYLYHGNDAKIVSHINGYLTAGPDIFITKRSSSVSNLPTITRTNPALDDGHLLLTREEKNLIIKEYPESEFLIKKIIGAAEFLRGLDKYCLWIHDENLNLALSIFPIKQRIDKVRNYRQQRKTKNSGIDPVNKPHQFLKMKLGWAIFIPTVSSERRNYIPIDFIDDSTVIIDPNFAIYDPEPWVFAVISSRMHMAWVSAVSGRLKTDYRYSSTLCYNTFPFPKISEDQKKMLTFHVNEVLCARPAGETLADIYDPDKMPQGLRSAHEYLDLAIDSCYRTRPFNSDEERLEHLFTMYEKMVNNT